MRSIGEDVASPSDEELHVYLTPGHCLTPTRKNGVKGRGQPKSEPRCTGEIAWLSSLSRIPKHHRLSPFMLASRLVLSDRLRQTPFVLKTNGNG